MKEIQREFELLVQLQKIDSARDDIKKQRGSLPRQIMELTDKFQHLQKELQTCKDEIITQKELIISQKAIIKDATELIAKYNQEHLNAATSPEDYDHITREISLQELDIKLAKKKTKTAQATIHGKNERIEELKKLLSETEKTKQEKENNLQNILASTQKEDERLAKESEQIKQKIKDTQLLEKYEALRTRFPLALTTIRQEVCNGCYIIVPRQRQVKIREAKKVFLCENCDRILVDAEPIFLEEEKKTRRRKKASDI